MSKEEFWANITLYMDRLHSMELFLLEELDNCQGNIKDLDLLSLSTGTPSQTTSSAKSDGSDQNDLLPSVKSNEEERPALEEWEISLYDVAFKKRIGRGRLEQPI